MRLLPAMFGLYAVLGLVLNVGITVFLALWLSRRRDVLYCKLCLSLVVDPELPRFLRYDDSLLAQQSHCVYCCLELCLDYYHNRQHVELELHIMDVLQHRRVH